jgi:hypothetical protein
MYTHTVPFLLLKVYMWILTRNPLTDKSNTSRHLVNVYKLYQIRNLLMDMNTNKHLAHHNRTVYYTWSQIKILRLDNTTSMNMKWKLYNNLMYNMLFHLDYHQMDMNKNMNMNVAHYILV